MGTILRLGSVTKSFGGLVAVDNFTLDVRAGVILGLIGPNGAGKTTVLNLIAGALRPTKGVVEFKGEDITGLKSEVICRRGLARTFQISQPFPKMTVLENVLVAAVFGDGHHRTAGTSDPPTRARQALEFVAFSLPQHTLASELNSAQLKRLDLARALASNPQLLLLDEIGAGLTPTEISGLMQLIRKIRDEKGITIVVVEHVMRMIMGICERIVVLQQGQKIAEGTPTEIVHDRRVVEAYLGEADSQ